MRHLKLMNFDYRVFHSNEVLVHKINYSTVSALYHFSFILYTFNTLPRFNYTTVDLHF